MCLSGWLMDSSFTFSPFCSLQTCHPHHFNLFFLTVHSLLSLSSWLLFSPSNHPLASFLPIPTSHLSLIFACLRSHFFCAMILYSPLALISPPLPVTAGWNSGKYPTDLNRTLPGGSRGRPCRRTEATTHRSAGMVRVEKTNCYEITEKYWSQYHSP